MVHIHFKDKSFEVGSADFLNSFFSTVFIRLENGTSWGSRFPIILNHFYQGKLVAGQLDAAIDEINQIREELKSFSPEDVVWDYENRSLCPPWGDNINSSITSLSNYFITSNGKDLLALFLKIFSDAKTQNYDLWIE